MKQTQKPLTQDPIFVRIVVSSTGLGLALMLGSLAAVKFTDANRLQFGWNWFIPLWMAVAVIGNQRFWKAVWQAQNDPTPKAKKRLTIHSALLVALAIGAFLYPLRFIEQSRWIEVARGLATAVVFLGTVGTIIYQFGRGFAEGDGITAEPTGNT